MAQLLALVYHVRAVFKGELESQIQTDTDDYSIGLEVLEIW